MPEGKTNNTFVLHSALQKAIRRGNEHDALEAVWQLDMEAGVSHTRSRAGGMWSIMRRCCAEDVDSVAVLPAIETLWRFWEKQCESRRNTHEPWRVYTFKAVMLLCAAPKSRRVDNALTVIPPGKLEATVEEFHKTGRKSFPIPAYAHDGIHTGEGDRRTKLEFMVAEDAVLNPRSDTDDEYFREIARAAEGAVLQVEADAKATPGETWQAIHEEGLGQGVQDAANGELKRYGIALEALRFHPQQPYWQGYVKGYEDGMKEN